MESHSVTPTANHFSNTSKYSLALAGVICFPLLHCLCRMLLVLRWPWMSHGVAFRISTRLVSAFQSLLVVCVSTRTIFTCTDIMRDQDPLLHAYVWFGMSYFPYDILVMFIGYSYTHKSLETEKTFNAYIRLFGQFFQRECVIVLHHILFLVVGFPVLEYYKGGLGDFFVGCFFLAEISTPFYSLKGIFRESGINSGLLYEINGLVFMATFLISRVLSVPLMFWKYARFSGVSLLEVPQRIPLKCNGICLCFFLLQCYWFSLICYNIVKHVNKKKKDANINSNRFRDENNKLKKT